MRRSTGSIADLGSIELNAKIAFVIEFEN